jgi:serine-type D-Ala-D-Ala carboxypeptidase/endopeptidase
MWQRLVQRHNGESQKAANWDIPTLAGAGALRSTTNDLLHFFDACTGRIDTPLTPLLPLLFDVRRQAGRVAAAAGWLVDNGSNYEIIFKDGSTGGYTSLIAYSTRSKAAAVLLSNSGTEITRALGLHILNTDFRC